MLFDNEQNVKIVRKQEAILTIDRSQNVADRRVGRTQQLLFDALLALVQEKRYNKITVQEILDRANVGRSTFYAHFQDKDDLLTGNFATLAVGEVFAEMGKAPQGEGDGKEERAISQQIVVPMLSLLQHARDNFHLYEALRDNDGMEVVLGTLRKSLVEIIAARVRVLRPDLDDGRHNLVCHFLCEGAIATMLVWLEDEQVVAAEEIDERLQNMMRAALASF